MLIRKVFLRRPALFALVIALGIAPILIHAEEPRQHWSAIWISHPTAPLREPIVLHFRKAIELSAAPQHYIVHVSGDRRFLFYVNGQRIGAGPAASDPPHWRYETFDLAPVLHAGTNLQPCGTSGSTRQSPRCPTAPPSWCRGTLYKRLQQIRMQAGL